MKKIHLERKLDANELAFLKTITAMIVDGGLRSFCVAVETQKGNDLSITSRASRPLIGRIYKGLKA